MVTNPPSNSRVMDSIPGQGTKIPYAVGQLNPCATTRELSAAPKINKTKTIYHVRFNSRSKSDIFYMLVNQMVIAAIKLKDSYSLEGKL